MAERVKLSPEVHRQRVLEELRRLADRIASTGRPATIEEMEAVFKKADELPLAGRSLEREAEELQTV